MRPVNLMPPEELRGDKAPMRTGPLAYVVVGVLAVALIAVTVTVMTSNQISDKQTEKAGLEAQLAEAQAQAQRLKSFADFASVQQARELTVSTLARSRFDWERVLRELAIVIPSDVWLTNIDATVSGTSSTGTSSTPSTSSSSVDTSSIAGPSLTIQGCADGHDAVAGFIAALHDIDGVTRVTVVSSDRPDSQAGVAASSASASAGGAGCSSRALATQFQVVAAFDAVQLGAADSSGVTPATPAAPTTTTTTEASTGSGAGTTTTASSSDGTQVADAQQQVQQSKDSAARQSSKGRKAVDTLLPGTGSAP
ncbi:MAG: PilN domain-containing protein [Solirubrobacterales bacterium]